MSICLLAQVLISFRLWIPAGRVFPEVPLFSFLTLEWGSFINWLLYFSMLCALIGLLVKPLNRILLLSTVGLFFLFVLEDVNRLQPWLYLFALMFLLLGIFRNNIKSSYILRLFQLILVLLYFWSGFQKLNYSFSENVFPWLMVPFGGKEYFFENQYWAWVSAVLEMLAGIGLLYRRTTIVSKWILIATHVLILIVIGPFSYSWNYVVWPWNVAMIVLLFKLFTKDNSVRADITGITKWSYAIVFSLWLVLPALNFVGYWDDLLSGCLYSGNKKRAVFYYHISDKNNLPKQTSDYRFHYEGDEEEWLMIHKWIVGELQVPFYAEQRYFKYLGKELCDCVKDKENSGIRIRTKKKFTSEQTISRISCEKLLQ